MNRGINYSKNRILHSLHLIYNTHLLILFINDIHNYSIFSNLFISNQVLYYRTSVVIYSLWKVILATNGHTFLPLILNIDLFPFLWGNGNLMVITQPV